MKKKTLLVLSGATIGAAVLLMTAAVSPEIPTTDYTFGFMTNETAASARAYLGVSAGGALPYTMVGTNLTAGVLPFVGTYKTNLMDGPAITTLASNAISQSTAAAFANIIGAVKTNGDTILGSLAVTNGITATDIIATNNHVVNVRSYGAVGDGVVEDTTTIRSAIAAAAASGSTLYFPNGNYLVDNLTNISGCPLWLGEGTNSALVFKTTSTGFAVTFTNNTSMQGISILDGLNNVSFNYAGATATNRSGLSYWVSGVSSLRDVYVSGFGSNGVYVVGTTGTTARDAYGVVANAVIQNCYIGLAIAAGAAEYARVSSAHIHDCAIGFYNGSANVEAAGLLVHDCYYGGYIYAGADKRNHGTLTGSSFNHTTKSLVLSNFNTGITIQGCRIMGGGSMIWTNVSGVLFENNLIQNTALNIDNTSAGTSGMNVFQNNASFGSFSVADYSGKLINGGNYDYSGNKLLVSNGKGGWGLSTNQSWYANQVIQNWPSTQGSAGTFLVNDGSGNLTWTNTLMNSLAVTNAVTAHSLFATNGVSATVDVLIHDLTTNRLVFVGGILVSNITTFAP